VLGFSDVFSYLSERTFSWKYMNIYVDFSLRLFVAGLMGWDPAAAGRRAGDGMARFVSEEEASAVPYYQ
jgi:hypothetical protein